MRIDKQTGHDPNGHKELSILKNSFEMSWCELW